MKRLVAAVLLASELVATTARADRASVYVAVDAGVPERIGRRISDAAAARRVVRADVPVPPAVVTPAIDPRVEPIRLALERAKKAESLASFDECVREAANTLGSAVDLLAATGELDLLRDLHVELGVCLALGDAADSARSHFEEAALLDESPPPVGAHRSDAEKAQGDARAAVLSRARGKVRVETEPPGAEVWLDGKKLAGTTPLDVDARLGAHYLTLRRFRMAPKTERRSLVPGMTLKLALDPAPRDVLGEQLASPPPSASADELRLARAAWSRAEQALFARTSGGALELVLEDAPTGRAIRTAKVPIASDDATVRKAVCAALGESCDVARGVPWYVWPLAGAAVVGGAVAIGFAVQSGRDLRVCPATGCH